MLERIEIPYEKQQRPPKTAFIYDIYKIVHNQQFVEIKRLPTKFTYWALVLTKDPAYRPLNRQRIAWHENPNQTYEAFITGRTPKPHNEPTKQYFTKLLGVEGTKEQILAKAKKTFVSGKTMYFAKAIGIRSYHFTPEGKFEIQPGQVPESKYKPRGILGEIEIDWKSTIGDGYRLGEHHKS